MSLKKHIPNAITSLNLQPELHGTTYVPFIFMLAAVLFDFCDGLAARLIGAYSPVGKELDSLADVVSFGVLPALMMYFYCSLFADGIAGYFVWVPLLIAVFSALRLAKFNLDERQHSSFIGLPTPASALICGSLCCLLAYLPESFGAAIPWIIIGVSLILCTLLVCELPMFSLKLKPGHNSFGENKARYILIASSVIILLVSWFLGFSYFAASPALIILLYLLLSIIF